MKYIVVNVYGSGAGGGSLDFPGEEKAPPSSGVVIIKSPDGVELLRFDQLKANDAQELAALLELSVITILDGVDEAKNIPL